MGVACILSKPQFPTLENGDSHKPPSSPRTEVRVGGKACRPQAPGLSAPGARMASIACQLLLLQRRDSGCMPPHRHRGRGCEQNDQVSALKELIQVTDDRQSTTDDKEHFRHLEHL